jgi:hydrogenase expression/formation protein HypD
MRCWKVQEMNDNRIVERLNRCFEDIRGQDIRIMEVCGTHTRAIAKSGIRYLLPKEVVLLSGPGCPVCVTPEPYIDMAIEMLNFEGVVLVTFGDMIKVKGTYFSLLDRQAQGSKITVVYSPEDALTIAAKNTDKLIVFIAVGFETTAPLIAVTVRLAKARGLDNLFFLTALKCMEPAIRFILQDSRNKINAMICPGHVASIKGAGYFRFITEEFGIPAVVCGFENQDLSAGICLLLEQLTGKRNIEFMNLYKRCVSFTACLLKIIPPDTSNSDGNDSSSINKIPSAKPSSTAFLALNQLSASIKCDIFALESPVFSS